MNSRRLLSSALALGAIAPLVSTLAQSAPTAESSAAMVTEAVQGKKPDPDSAAECGKCHTEIHEEWKVRGHSGAWRNELYQREIKPKKRPQSCHGCHIPGSVHDRVGRKPKTRKVNLHEGVTCVTCHKKGADMLGPFGAKTAAHATAKDAMFTEQGADAMCKSCHNTKIAPVLPVWRDFDSNRAAFAKDKVVGCISCHMPVVERHMAVDPKTGKPDGAKREGRSHRILGAYDAEFCGKAFGLAAKKKAGGDIAISLTNKAGHRVPGSKYRKFVFVVEQRGAGGAALGSDKFEIDADNLLNVLETRDFTFKAKAGAADVKITVDHVHEDKKVATVKTVTLKL